MLEIFKKLFAKPVEVEPEEDKPGRTFNKILTGKYYGLDDNNADKTLISELKDKKIHQIQELELKPKYLRYIYDKNTEDYTVTNAISVQVSFQKERYSQKRQMIHVSEMSFIVKAEDFDEFEKKLDISLQNDFRHLEPENTFDGTERRKQNRAA
ncbi:MAG TPA: hypothetical protein EYG82_05905 [Sulfurovum sp.]|nr:hypothetical protein [Sulfurovum sp.]